MNKIFAITFCLLIFSVISLADSSQLRNPAQNKADIEVKPFGDISDSSNGPSYPIRERWFDREKGVVCYAMISGSHGDAISCIKMGAGH